jgi:hypothetical protein
MQVQTVETLRRQTRAIDGAAGQQTPFLPARRQRWVRTRWSAAIKPASSSQAGMNGRWVRSSVCTRIRRRWSFCKDKLGAYLGESRHALRFRRLKASQVAVDLPQGRGNARLTLAENFDVNGRGRAWSHGDDSRHTSHSSRVEKCPHGSLFKNTAAGGQLDKRQAR